MGSSVSVHLNAIRLFIRSTRGPRFLHEFTSVGGVINLLDLISHQQKQLVNEEDRRKAFELLCIIARAQYSCRQMMCEAGAIKLAKKSMQKNEDRGTLRKACDLLGEIGKVSLHADGNAEVNALKKEDEPVMIL